MSSRDSRFSPYSTASKVMYMLGYEAALCRFFYWRIIWR